MKGVSIGQRNNNKIDEGAMNGPGPGYYDTYSKRPTSGTKIGRASRNMISDINGPGPGAYDVNYKSKLNTEVKMGTSTRKDLFRAQTPGPGAYELNQNKQKGITISGNKQKMTYEISPGPGSYDPFSD
jgi:hypothetical protein